MVVITGYYHLTRSVKLKLWPGGHVILFTATSDCLPSHPANCKDGRATDSCFILIGAHQCALIVNAGRLTASKSTPSETLVV